MTSQNKKGVKILSEIEKAILEVKNSGLYGNQVHQETLELSLEALQEKQEREKGCEYCNSDALKNAGIKYSWGTPSIVLFGGNSKPDKNESFKFCPNCGRDLRGENDG